MRADSRSGNRQRNELRAAARARLLAAPSSPENDLAQDEHERFWRTHDTAAAPVAPAAPAVGLVADYTVRVSGSEGPGAAEAAADRANTARGL